MKGALRIATVFNIPVLIHWTFIFILLAGFYWGFSRGGLFTAIWSLSLILVLFFCVLLHEFGHALTARHFNVTTKDIILSPIGGIARLNKLPKQPLQEMLVAAAGPIVNIVIALLISPLFLIASPEKRIQLYGALFPSSNVFINDLSLFDRLLLFVFFLNVVLAIFNLLPAFPMDGGRILRALLTTRMNRMKATRVAMYIGQAIAILFIYMGITEFEIGTVKLSFMIAFIGLFVFISAANEYRYVKFINFLEKTCLSEVIRTNWTPFYPDTAMEFPVEAYAQGKERSFMVFNEWHEIVGILPEKQLKQVIQLKDFGAKVRDYMIKNKSTLLLSDTADIAIEKMQESNSASLPVFLNGKMIGIVEEKSINDHVNKLAQSGASQKE